MTDLFDMNPEGTSGEEAAADPDMDELRAFVALSPTEKFHLLIQAIEWMSLLRSAQPAAGRSATTAPGTSEPEP